MRAVYTIVGMKHRDAADFVALLPSGEPLLLLREPNNRHDRNAVQVWARGRHIAYIARRENAKLALSMDLKASIADFKLEGRLVHGAASTLVEVEESPGNISA